MSRAPLAERLRRTYLQLDLRSLALGRMVLGLVLIVDLLRRVPWLRDFYSNLGLLPTHTVLWRPPFPRSFSVFFMASWPDEAALGFVVAFVCFACFLVGYRTRLFQLLSFAMTVSLHNRIVFAESSGAVAIAVLMVWTIFLPLGRRFSVDALRASLRARSSETPPELAAGVPPPDTHQTTSLAALGLLLQIAVIYWFNFANQTGPTWRQGTAVHYLLWQERIVTHLGLVLRTHAPFAVTKLLTEGTLAIEGAAAFLILTPIFWRWTRFAAAVLLLGLHGGIALLVNLGIFSAAMIAFLPFLLTDAQWALFARLVPKRGRARTVFYDADCGICWAVVRVVARLDAHRRLRWLPNTDAAALPGGVAPDLVEQTILVVDPERARRWTRAAAFAQIFGALPFGRLWAWPLRVPPVSWLAGRAYDLVARNRTSISVWLGMAACGVGAAGGPGAHHAAASTAPPFRAWLRAQRPLVREVGAALVFLLLGIQVLAENPAVPPSLRFPDRPRWMVAAAMYPHITEGWGLFAPDVPTTAETIFVDAVTRDGRHVDPYNQIASRVARVPLEDVPARLGQDSFFCNYTLHIPSAGADYQALLAWVLRYPERMGRAEDTIVAFKAFVVTHDSPRPGTTIPTHRQTRAFLRWPGPAAVPSLSRGAQL